MTSRRTVVLAGLGLAALAFPFAARAEDEPDRPRRFMMQDVNGTIVTDETLIGRFALIYFGYTGCPDICPTSMMTMATALESLGPLADRVLPIFVTVDPARDNPKLLSQYVSAFDERIVALTGPKEFVDAMVKAYGAKYEFHVPDPAHPEDYSVDHTASLFFQGPDGRVMERFQHGLATEEIVARMSAAIEAAPTH